MIPPNVDTWLYPTTNPYQIVWGSTSTKSDLTETTTINRNEKNKYLHVVFFDSSFENRSTNLHHRRYAEISMLSHLRNNDLMEEDSFSEGDYLLELNITWDNGGNRKEYLMITIDHLPEQSRQTIRKLSFTEKLRVKRKKHL